MLNGDEHEHRDVNRDKARRDAELDDEDYHLSIALPQVFDLVDDDQEQAARQRDGVH